ncbi:MAG: VacJ family lipoprotein [Rhodospirillales bacterium]|nr:MAG: VacJ family lipoprotein [Rhodospirillales bacterium]
MPRSARGRRVTTLLALILALSACATRPTDPEELAYFNELNDPLEPMNRAIFEFNQVVDRALLRPLAIGYRTVLPRGVRAAVRNFINNLEAPVVLINDLLQGEGLRARDTVGRFTTNTILGLGGLIDIATDAGIPYHDEDFGQTLAVWGFDSGPYLILPLYGPSNIRDTAGLAGDIVLDPVGYYIRREHGLTGSVIRYTVDTVDWRAANLELIDELRRSSIDFYAATRSAYRQQRANEIRNGRFDADDPGGLPPMIEFDAMDNMGELGGDDPTIRQAPP